MDAVTLGLAQADAKKKYAKKTANTAALRRLGAGHYRDAFPPVMGTPPTIAWTAPGGTTPINAGSPRKYPWQTGQVSVRGGLLSKDGTRDLGINSVNAGWTPPAYYVEFDWYSAQSAPTFAIPYAPSSTATNDVQAWLWVADAAGSGWLPATADASTTTVASATNTTGFFQATFATPGQRRIRVYLRNMRFGGLHVHPTDSIGPVRSNLTKVAWLGDSWIDGATGATSTLQGLATTIGRMLGVELSSVGQGGTGYKNPGSTGHTYYGDPTRISGIVALNPDLLIISGSSNDDTTNGSWTSADVGTAAAACFSAVAAALPAVPIIVIGPPALPSVPANRLANRDAIKSACTAAPNVIGFLDQLDPFNVATTAPTWAAGTVYTVGQIITNSGLPYECVVAHTSSASFSSSSFQPLFWIYGSGKVGAATGVGNSDYLIQNDATHPSQAGHDYLARQFSEWILRLLTTIART